MKIYKLYIQPTLKIMSAVVLVTLISFGMLLFSGVLKDRRGEGPPWFVGVFLLGVVGFNGYYWVVRIPHRIVASDDGNVEFISLVRRKKVPARKIRIIAPAASQLGFLYVKSDKGKILILNQFDKFHEFLTWLRTINPAVELRGC